MKRLTLLLTSFFIITISWSQPSQLIIQGETGKLYLVHTVAAKENWYSVGRMYNISPKEIAPFNGLTMSKPLEIGEQLKIPLQPVNFSQNGSKAASETFVPVYHIIQEREWMFHISNTYNKVPIENLEKWNHINKDQAKAGMQLIVGYLKVKTDQSALVNGGTDKVIATTPALTIEPAKLNNSPAVKEEKNINTTTTKQSVAKVDSPKAISTTSAPANNSGRINTYAVEHSTGGFFSMEFNGNNKIVSGQANTFKSTSGWNDGKYYALMNNVPVGTIIRVTSPATSKFIFAKVLGQLPDMKESTGLAIRISNAAAADLGTGEGKFPVEIKY